MAWAQANGATVGEQAGAGRAVISYLPAYRMDTFDPNAARFLTDLIYFSIDPTAAGDLDLAGTKPEHLQRLRALRERYHFRLLVAVGGGDLGKSFPACALNLKARRHLVNELVNYCRQNKLDGIDFDWEFPKGQAEEIAFTALIVETKHALEPDSGLVTAAVDANQNLRRDAIAAVDRLHLMSYDHPGRHSTLEMARADVKNLSRRGIPTKKIALGVPFYGRKLTNHDQAATYEELARLYHPAANVDEIGGYYFNGIQTIQAKTRFAREAGMAGIMIWEMGQDARDKMSLLRAIHQALQP
jgi:GH18 family chitinase